jgi:hypothetical protein
MTCRLVLLVLAVSLAAPAAASATYRDFRSPSGKIGCAFYRDAQTPAFVRCDWRGSNDQTVELFARGRAKLRRATDSVMNPNARVLHYGDRTRFRSLRCRSRRTGMTCRSLRSGHGFKVSVEKRVLF